MNWQLLAQNDMARAAIAAPTVATVLSAPLQAVEVLVDVVLVLATAGTANF